MYAGLYADGFQVETWSTAVVVSCVLSVGPRRTRGMLGDTAGNSPGVLKGSGLSYSLECKVPEAFTTERGHGVKVEQFGCVQRPLETTRWLLNNNSNNEIATIYRVLHDVSCAV